ncbi:MAG: hypothetical protein JXA96_05075 [Sedimentisphaerales bacterium]|nr:hypothetical protein [Sedimentisphaerales bacterium]
MAKSDFFRKPYLDIVEKRYSELIMTEKSKLSKLDTATEYVITDNNKDEIVSHLLKSIAAYENVISEYERLYLQAAEQLLQPKSQEEIANLEKFIAEIAKKKKEYEQQHTDQYSLNYSMLEDIFNVDLRGK